MQSDCKGGGHIQDQSRWTLDPGLCWPFRAKAVTTFLWMAAGTCGVFGVCGRRKTWSMALYAVLRRSVTVLWKGQTTVEVHRGSWAWRPEKWLLGSLLSRMHLPLSAPKYHTERGSNTAPNCISYFLFWILLDFDSLPTEVWGPTRVPSQSTLLSSSVWLETMGKSALHQALDVFRMWGHSIRLGKMPIPIC